jgi:hypothetical protein
VEVDVVTEADEVVDSVMMTTELEVRVKVVTMSLLVLDDETEPDVDEADPTELDVEVLEIGIVADTEHPV